MSHEHSFVDMVRCDGYLVIALRQIVFRKDIGASEPIQNVIDPGEWIHVPDGTCIQPPVIDTHSEAPIFLSHKQHWRCKCTTAGAYPAIGQVCLELCT